MSSSVLGLGSESAKVLGTESVTVPGSVTVLDSEWGDTGTQAKRILAYRAAHEPEDLRGYRVVKYHC